MAKCWTCGSNVSGYNYTCSTCRTLKGLNKLRDTVEASSAAVIDSLNEVRKTISTDLSELSSEISTGFAAISSAIEWGFDELAWRIQLQTEILKSIDHTLKTPSETRANEWRFNAEELRRRGVLEESEEFFLKALNEYRLDYRIYVGLAETYLQMNKFDQARTLLERSIPHAPKKEIDYKSYSYRLIGHIHACSEDYALATAALKKSIELSQSYAEGHYDQAQYSAQIKDGDSCVSSLHIAIHSNPAFWYLAQKERNFGPLKSEVGHLLFGIREQASNRAKESLSKVSTAWHEAKEKIDLKLTSTSPAVSKAEHAQIISRNKGGVYAKTILDNARNQFGLASDKIRKALATVADKINSGDYGALLEAQSIANDASRLIIDCQKEGLTQADKVLEQAHEEQERFEKIHSEKVKNAWLTSPALIFYAIIGGFIGGFAGCTVGLFVPGKGTADSGFGLGFMIGLIIGVIIAARQVARQLE